MAKLVYMEVPRENLSDVSIVNGQIINCIDSHEIFYDNANTIRILSSRFEVVPIEDITNHEYSVDKVYVIRAHVLEDSYVALIQDNQLIQVGDSNAIADLVSSHTQLRSGVLTKGGVPFSPHTLARDVFTDDGEPLADFVKYITEMKESKQSIVVDIEKKEFELDLPNAITVGITLVYIDGTYIDMTSYNVDYLNKKITFNENIEAGKRIDLHHLLATKPSFSTGVYKYIDGGYIQKKTITTDKLKKVASTYTEVENDAIVTQQLLYNMYSNINTRLNNVDPTSMIRASDASSNRYQIVTTIVGYRLIDCNTITIRTRYDLGSNCTIKINNMDPVPIYMFDGTPIKDGAVYAGRVITLRYNAQSNRFYLLNGDMYRLVTERSVQIFDGIENSAPSPTVPIGIENYVHGIDKLDVYQNNIRLFEGINFNVSGSTIYLDGYYAETGDVFVIEVTRVIPNNE